MQKANRLRVPRETTTANNKGDNDYFQRLVPSCGLDPVVIIV